MDGSAVPLPVLISGEERINGEYVRAVQTALARGAFPADPQRTPLWQARRDAVVWHRYWDGRLPFVRKVVDHYLHGPAGPVRLRMFHALRRLDSPLVVYFHGGGFVLNGLFTHERLMRDLAVRARMTVCGVGYSLAPERRFPVQLEEAVTSVRWLAAQAADLGIRPDRIALVGDSAGANLALATACALRDSGDVSIAFLGLFYGMFSADDDTPSHRAFGTGAYGLSTARVRWFWDQYFATPHDRDDPWAVPLRASLSGLPPTLIIGAGLDCLLDDSLNLASRLQAAGVPHILSVYEDLPHGFAIVASAVRRADDAIAEIVDALQSLHRPDAFHRWVERHDRAQAVHRRLATALSNVAQVTPASRTPRPAPRKRRSRRAHPTEGGNG